MLCVFRLKKFSGSRWVTVGESCRSLLAAMSLGLEGLVSMVRESPKASGYHIHGFGQLGHDTVRYDAVAAASSHLGTLP